MTEQKPRTVWVHRDGYSIELTEDEIRRAYAQFKEPDRPEHLSHGSAVSQMTSDIYKTMDDLAYILKRRESTPSGPFGTW